MPELPEVETTCLGIKPFIEGQTVTAVTVRRQQLRWPVAPELSEKLPQQIISKVSRRGKYLLFTTQEGTLIAHLGMSGSMRILTTTVPPRKHDHIDIYFSNTRCLRFNDPRCFGSFLWTEAEPLQHPLLKNLGPEPLTQAFDADYLFNFSRGRKTPIKRFIMAADIVVGIGNIYANEALFYAGIHPHELAGNLNFAQYYRLVEIIKRVLAHSIKIGGTTIRNFSGGDGKPGYFKQQLRVYGREGLACLVCQNILLESRLGQRTTIYCPQCQAMQKSR